MTGCTGSRFHVIGGALLLSGLVVVLVIGRMYSDNGALPSVQYQVPRENQFIFEGLTGPGSPSRVPAVTVADPGRYGRGELSRLAILLTDRDSPWMGLVHGLRSIGLPVRLTEDYREALRHQVVLVYPRISGRTLNADALKALADFPRQGGTLIGTHVLGGGLNEVFGFQDVQASRAHYEIRWNRTSPFTSEFTETKEQILRLGDRRRGKEPVGTYSYLRTKEPPLAVFDDGSAAVTYRSYGQGQAIALGIDLGFLLLNGYNLRDESIAERYANGFEPLLDVWLRFMKAIYIQACPDAVTLDPVPFRKAAAVILTHDIDAQTSMANAIRYAELERNHGIVGTYFIQTKYIKDYNDEIFFNEQGVRDMRTLHSLGMELGSHTVAHSKVLDRFPIGSGTEQYPFYTPYVKTRMSAYNGTVLGELRVSKYLIETLSAGARVVSFRPGELSNPTSLPQALTATGYVYSSSATADNSLTHFPYQLMYGRGTEGEVPVFEFPVTIEDEELPELGPWLSQALELYRQISRYGGSVVVLIHPNILGHKLEFERKFVAAVKESAWFGSIAQFGAWWAARNQVAVDVRREGRVRRVSLDMPAVIAGLGLRIPPGWKLQGGSGAVAAQGDGFVVLGEVKGAVTLIFEAPPETVASIS